MIRDDLRCTRIRCSAPLDVGRDLSGIPYGICPQCGAQFKILYGEPRMVKEGSR